MKILQGKKGRILAFGLAITLLIALSRVYYLVEAQKADIGGEMRIGANQLSLFAGIQNAEKAIIYGEEGFSLALQQSLYEILKSGGNISSCGNERGYDVWKNGDRECYPELNRLNEKIAEETLELMNTKYLNKNPYVKFDGPYKNNHEIFIEQKGQKMIARAFALASARQDFVCSYGVPSYLDFGSVVVKDVFASEKLGACGRYYYKPSLRKELDFDIRKVVEVIDGAKDFSTQVDACEKKGNSIASCAKNAITDIDKESSLNWSLCEPLAGVSRSFILCADTGKKILAKNPTNNKLGLEKAEIRFIMTFPEKEVPEVSTTASAEIEFEENDWFILNIRYKFIDGVWKWRCPSLLCGYTQHRELTDSATSGMTTQFKEITSGLNNYKNDYDNGAKWIQQKIKEDDDGYLIIHYEGECEVTTPKGKGTDILPELARSPASPPSGTSCD